MRRGVRTLVVVVLGSALLAAAPAALANDFQKVYDYYKRHGSIPACRFSTTQLKNAVQQTPPDVEQYAPSFLDAVGTAREGDCSKKPAAATPAPAPTTTTPTPSTPTAAPTPSVPTTAPAATPAQPVATTATPAPTPPAAATSAPQIDTKPAAHKTSAPVAVWSLAGLAALVLLAALAAAIAWMLGWGPARPIGRRDFGREFADWLRFGA